MRNLINYNRKHAFDKGLNLLQKSNSSTPNTQRMITSQTSNRSIGDGLYQSLGLTLAQKANLNQTLLDKGIFDRHGNQLKADLHRSLSWDYRNMLQTTTTELSDGGKLKEYNTYTKAGQRNRKVAEKTDATGSTTEISESMYLGNLEYRTTWQGENLSYDGETVIEQSTGAALAPDEQYTALRIRQGHKQVAQKKIYQYKDGIKVTERATTYTMDNNIDSCELTLNGSGQLESYESYKPYGATAISYGKTSQQPYKYSGQEKDESGLYYYGYRSYLPTNFRWMSPDPAGIRGSDLNWYVMVSGNPLTMRDEYGLGPFDRWLSRLTVPGLMGVGALGFGYLNKEKISEKWYGSKFETIINYKKIDDRLNYPIDGKMKIMVYDTNALSFRAENRLSDLIHGKAHSFDKISFDTVALFDVNEKIPEDDDLLKKEVKARFKEYLKGQGGFDESMEDLDIYSLIHRNIPDDRGGIFVPHIDKTEASSNPELKDRITHQYNVWILKDSKIMSPKLALMRLDTFNEDEDQFGKNGSNILYNEKHKWYSNFNMKKGDAYVFNNSKTPHTAVVHDGKKNIRNSVELRISQYKKSEISESGSDQ